MRQRTLGVVLIAIGLIGLVGTGWAFAARSDRFVSRPRVWAPLGGARGGPTCNPPSLPGQTVDVVLSDMGRMMSGARMMNVTALPPRSPPGRCRSACGMRG